MVDRNTDEPLKIALLSGGSSAEREISLQSGAAVSDALSGSGHRVTGIDPRETDPAGVDWTAFDVAFIALHGTFGDDGEIQRILDAAGIPFTGSSAGTSRLAFSKSAAKERMSQFQIPTPPAVLIHETDSADRIEQRLRSIGLPAVVKPDAQGSSLGVSIVREAADLPAALTACFHYHPFGLLEQFMDGAEWTAAVIDDEILPPMRILPAGSFFDFHAKYRDETTGYDFDGGVSAAVREVIGATAQRACRALGTRGAARVDVILDGFDRPWVLEINTIPGFTAHSLLPKAAEEAGYDFGELCERLVRGAMRAVTRRAA